MSTPVCFPNPSADWVTVNLVDVGFSIAIILLFCDVFLFFIQLFSNLYYRSYTLQGACLTAAYNFGLILQAGEMLDSFNEFTIYRGNSTKTLHSEYVYRYSLPFEKVGDKVGWTLLFQNCWQHSITISIVYYILIRLLQWVMQDRKPFDLRQPLVLWNGALAVFSILGFIRFSEDFAYNWWHRGLPYSLCHSCNPDSVAAFWSLLFAISKVVELGDTLFIVLRKKTLIFLHYYHHAAVLVYTVHSGAEHTAPGQAFITMNYLAHSVMYTYYTLTAYGKRPPKWVSMVVTSVQTTQMFAGVAVTAFVYKWKVYDNYRCQQSMANLYLAFVIYITFAVLFVQFFTNAYLKNKKDAKILEKSLKKKFW